MNVRVGEVFGVWTSRCLFCPLNLVFASPTSNSAKNMNAYIFHLKCLLTVFLCGKIHVSSNSPFCPFLSVALVASGTLTLLYTHRRHHLQNLSFSWNWSVVPIGAGRGEGEMSHCLCRSFVWSGQIDVRQISRRK